MHATPDARGGATDATDPKHDDARLGLAQLLHAVAFAALIAFGLVARLGLIYYSAMPLIAAALYFEHRSEKLDLVSINRAFFHSNAFVSTVFLLAVCIDRLR